MGVAIKAWIATLLKIAILGLKTVIVHKHMKEAVHRIFLNFYHFFQTMVTQKRTVNFVSHTVA